MKKQDQTIDRDQSKSKGVKVTLHRDFKGFFKCILFGSYKKFQLCLGDYPNEGKGEAGKKPKNDAQVEENLMATKRL